MPSKSANYGSKIWGLCANVQTTYAWRLQVYTGKSVSTPWEHNRGVRVVLQLTDELEGHTVTTDNFFLHLFLSLMSYRRGGWPWWGHLGPINLSSPRNCSASDTERYFPLCLHSPATGLLFLMSWRKAIMFLSWAQDIGSRRSRNLENENLRSSWITADAKGLWTT